MINDSAGISVNLIDKSERGSTAIGFRSAAVIEAARGLCETPVLISSEADYVKVFGSPSLDKFGVASMEAYLLAQRRVPQVITRARATGLDASAKQFAAFTFKSGDGKLTPNDAYMANKIGKPVDDNMACLFFKGEGDYPVKKSNNIVLRFSKPVEESAYADAGRVMHLQVFDFEGTNHIDTDVAGKLLFDPVLSDVVDKDGKYKDKLSVLLGLKIEDEPAISGTGSVTAYVNGIAGKAEVKSDSTTGSADTAPKGLWKAIADAIKAAKADEKPILPDDSYEWKVPTDADKASDNYIQTKVGGTTGTDGSATPIEIINAFDTSISLAIQVTLTFETKAKEAPQSSYDAVAAGTVAVTYVEKTGTSGESNGADGEKTYTGTAVITLSTSSLLANRSEYMFMGEGNSYWAAFYETYQKESWDISFSYDDYDANYSSLQADAVLKASNYLVAQTSDMFGSYSIQWEDEETEDSSSNGGSTKATVKADALVSNLQYFTADVTDNTIPMASKSFAYSQALSLLLADNLTRWRCVCTPNLGDIMVKGDFVAAIEAAAETTLGVSNIGKAASVDALNNLTGRHGNRFIADYSVYGYRRLNGRRTPITMACLITDLLNRNYNNGNEARPPFGYTYGQVQCDEISQVMSGPERQMLARQYKVNPVIEDGGYFTWDERTSQLKDTSLSDIHNILSFVWMKFQIYDAMKNFIAEYNDEETVSRGLSILDGLRLNWVSRKYIQEGLVNADKNVIGDEVLRFSVAIRFKGVARYVEVDVTAYSQTQSLAISLAQEV